MPVTMLNHVKSVVRTPKNGARVAKYPTNIRPAIIKINSIVKNIIFYLLTFPILLRIIITR